MFLNRNIGKKKIKNHIKSHWEYGKKSYKKKISHIKSQSEYWLKKKIKKNCILKSQSDYGKKIVTTKIILKKTNRILNHNRNIGTNKNPIRLFSKTFSPYILAYIVTVK